MNVRPQLHMVAAFQCDPLFLQQFAAVQRGELRMRRKKCVDDLLVFRGQQAAGGVDQPAAGFYQPRRGVEDRGLLDHQFGDALG